MPLDARKDALLVGTNPTERSAVFDRGRQDRTEHLMSAEPVRSVVVLARREPVDVVSACRGGVAGELAGALRRAKRSTSRLRLSSEPRAVGTEFGGRPEPRSERKRIRANGQEGRPRRVSSPGGAGRGGCRRGRVSDVRRYGFLEPAPAGVRGVLARSVRRPTLLEEAVRARLGRRWSASSSGIPVLAWARGARVHDGLLEGRLDDVDGPGRRLRRWLLVGTNPILSGARFNGRPRERAGHGRHGGRHRRPALVGSSQVLGERDGPERACRATG